MDTSSASHLQLMHRNLLLLLLQNMKIHYYREASASFFPPLTHHHHHSLFPARCTELLLSLPHGSTTTTAGSAPRSEEGAREKALVKLPFPKIKGPAPQFWEKAPPLKNGQFRGQKHLEHAPQFFHSFITNTKFTFCKIFGPNRPIQPSAVVRIFYCCLYGVPTTN